jgi:hypothetical protein
MSKKNPNFRRLRGYESINNSTMEEIPNLYILGIQINGGWQFCI